ncbi:hypothetical protein Q9233_016985, partial [Columba guinea]
IFPHPDLPRLDDLSRSLPISNIGGGGGGAGAGRGGGEAAVADADGIGSCAGWAEPRCRSARAEERVPPVRRREQRARSGGAGEGAVDLQFQSEEKQNLAWPLKSSFNLGSGSEYWEFQASSFLWNVAGDLDNVALREAISAGVLLQGEGILELVCEMHQRQQLKAKG